MWELLRQLAERGGPIGICLSLSYLYIRKLHGELREVETKRVQDSQQIVQKLLDLNDRWNEAVSSQVEVQEAQKNLLADLKSMIANQLRGRR